MRLPVAPRSGADDRARLNTFALRRGLEPGHRPAYAAARLAALGERARRDDPRRAARPSPPDSLRAPRRPRPRPPPGLCRRPPGPPGEAGPPRRPGAGLAAAG